MADNFKTIFELEPEMTGLLAELDSVNEKYGRTTKEMRIQQDAVTKLLSEEKALIDARKKANSPNEAVKYMQKIEETKKKIQELNVELAKTVQGNGQVATSAARAGDKIGKAYTVAVIQASRKEIQNVTTEHRKAGDEGKKGGEKVSNAFTKLKQDLKLAKAELADAFGTGNQEAIQKASEKVGLIKDQINDLNESTNAFASGSKFQQIGNLLGSVVQNIVGLDFERANEQSEALLRTTKQLTLKEAVNGGKALITTFVNLGRALLANPIFLIATVIAVIISKFDALRNAGGLVGKIFNGIAKAIDVVITAGKDLLDFLGIIDSTKKSLEELIDQQEQLIKQSEAFFNRQIALRKAANQSTIKLENERAFAVERALLKELNDTRKAMEERAASYEEFVDFQKKLIDIGIRASEVETTRNVRNTEVQVEARKKLHEINKQIADEQNKSAEFDIKFRLSPDSEKQIKAAFDLQRKELAQQQKEEERQAKLDFIDYDGGRKARALIDTKYSIIRTRLKNEETKTLIDKEKELALSKLEVTKDSLEKERAAELAETKITAEQAAAENTQVLGIYYAQRLQILENSLAKEKEAKLNTVETEKEISALKIEALEAEAAANRELENIRKAKQTDELDDAKSHADKIGDLSGKSESQRLFKQLDFERKRLEILKKFHSGEEAEIRKQNNLIAELDREAKEKRIQENIGYFEQLATAAIAAANTVISAKLSEVEKLSELQQERVDEAKGIADKGNAELLELEKQRLDNLNKEREKFVRQQQALAVVELIANTAIAVSKAAAQGGVAAGVTIAASLVALVAGLAAARSIASQAAFYEGGEFGGSGYTGNGNPTHESNAVGRKPYIYHKKEFIFNHKTTEENIDVFRRVHGGQVNLKEWESKVKAFDKMALGMNQPALFMNPIIPNYGNEYGKLESKVDKLIKAVESQEGMHLSLTDKGIVGLVTKFKARQDLIKQLSK